MYQSGLHRFCSIALDSVDVRSPIGPVRLGLAAESCLWVSWTNTSALGAMMPLPQRDSSMSDVPGHSGPDAQGTRVAFAWYRFNDR